MYFWCLGLRRRYVRGDDKGIDVSGSVLIGAGMEGGLGRMLGGLCIEEVEPVLLPLLCRSSLLGR